MTQGFNLVRDGSGQNTYARTFPTVRYSALIPQNIEKTMTVPAATAGALGDTLTKNWIAIFSYEPGSDVFVSVNGTAEVASGNFTTTTSELNPVAYNVQSSDVLSFITPNNQTYVGVSFYALP